ncbi:MAG: hypothetical protein WDO15_13190 [Bacteroidota bacterium]
MNRSNIRNEIHHITWELTGSELIALILEAQEIRRLWPKYNLAQKYRVEEWGIFDYEDRNGYHRFSVNVVHRGARPLITFSNKGDAWNFMWEKVRSQDLCPKLSGLQLAKGLCSVINPVVAKVLARASRPRRSTTSEYNKLSIVSSRKERHVQSLVKDGAQKRRSVVLVENGNFLGFGFFGDDVMINDFDSARTIIKPAKENRIVQNLVNSFLQRLVPIR